MTPRRLRAEGKARQVHKNLVPRHVRDSFDQLNQESEVNRSKASIVILKYADSIIQNQNVQETDPPEDVQHIIKRLLGGVMSIRQYAREGFYTTLQALLQLHPSIGACTYLTSVTKFSFDPKLSKEEAKRQLLGELLFYGALIRSGHANNNFDLRAKIIVRLLEMRKNKKKCYLDVMATQFLVNLMEKCEGVVMYKEVWKVLGGEVSQNLKFLSPCSLWLRLVLLRKHTHNPPAWLTATLHPDNYSTLAAILMDTLIDLPKVHPVLDEVVSSLATGDQLLTFWEGQLAPHLLYSNHNTLHLIFNILQLVLPRLTTVDEVSRVVSEPLVTLLISSLSRHDQDLSTAARGMASALLHLVATNQHRNSELQLAVVKSLVLPPGTLRFDHLTGTKLLSQMVSHFTVSSIKGYAELLHPILEGKIENMRPGEEKFAAHTLKVLLMHPSVKSKEHTGWQRQQLEALMKLALFSRGTHNELEEIRDAFTKALDNYSGYIKEYNSVLLHIVNVVDQELTSHKAAGTSPLSVGTAGKWSQVYSKLTQLQSEDVMDTRASQVFQILYGLMALHLFIEPETAKDIINELNGCCKVVLKKAKTTSKLKKGEPHWVEIVTELLLSLMTQEKNIFRSIAQGVFCLMCPMVTPAVLYLILDVLDPAKAQVLVGKNMDDDEEEEEKGEEEEEQEDSESSDDSDSEFEEEEEEGEEENEGIVGDDMEADEQVNDDVYLLDLKKKILTLTGTIDEDVDMDSVPADELDALDEELGPLFAEYLERQRRKKKGPSMLLDDERSLMNFQSRVCDLLDMYIKEAPKMGVMLELIIPLFEALQMAEKDKRLEPLQNRIRNLIHQLGKVRKFTATSDTTLAEVIEAWDSFFTMTLDLPENRGTEVRECYGLLLRCANQLLGETVCGPDNPVISAFIKHMQAFFAKKLGTLKLQAYLDPCTLSCSGLWKIGETMVHIAFNPEFKKNQRTHAIQILHKLYQNKTFLEERTEDVAVKIEAEMAASLVKILDELCRPEFIKIQLVASVFSLLLIIHKIDTMKGVVSRYDWKQLGEGVVAIRQCVSGKDLKMFRSEYNRLQQALKLPKTVCNVQKSNTSKENSKDQQATMQNSTDTGNKTKEKKKWSRVEKRNKDTKMKKDKKQKRVTFAGCESEDDEDNQMPEEAAIKKSKKRKYKPAPEVNDKYASLSLDQDAQPSKKKKKKKLCV